MENIALIKSSMLMKQDCFGKKCQPVLTLQSPKKTASGFKAAKDRVTLLLCSNASGDRMLKPLLVNRSLKPRALKGKDLNTLPVHWMANKKAWVTTAIFTEWFNKCFVPEVENYMNEMGLEFKILLILDNAPGHPILEHPNIKEIGGEGFDDFGEHDIEELLVDEALNDDDILESMVDITKDLETVDSEPEEDVTPLDEKLLREGLQLSVRGERGKKDGEFNVTLIVPCQTSYKNKRLFPSRMTRRILVPVLEHVGRERRKQRVKKEKERETEVIPAGL
ncbi:tigger transposable element-derived protein 1 [Trichonephila clavipes]|nr:tigger transposable element-derived protein 1 [Trichonephila clavipes]